MVPSSCLLATRRTTSSSQRSLPPQAQIGTVTSQPNKSFFLFRRWEADTTITAAIGTESCSGQFFFLTLSWVHSAHSLRRKYLVAGLAQGAPILLIESLPSQLTAAGATGEALGMVLPLHGLNSQLSRRHRLVTEAADIWGRGDTGCHQPTKAVPSHHPEYDAQCAQGPVSKPSSTDKYRGS